MLDLRVPSGSFFAITGLILIGVSFTNPHAPISVFDGTEGNVDLYTGLTMLAFGGFLLLLARLSKNVLGKQSGSKHI